MSLKTAFLNLFKPETGDRFSITGTEGYNKNMDLIDAAVKKNVDDITQLNSDITDAAKRRKIESFINNSASISCNIKNIEATSLVGYTGLWILLLKDWSTNKMTFAYGLYAMTDNKGNGNATIIQNTTGMSLSGAISSYELKIQMSAEVSYIRLICL